MWIEQQESTLRARTNTLTELDLDRLKAALDRLAAEGAPDASGPNDHAPARAAVAAVLRGAASRSGAEILLIERATHPHDPWSGHMALPGGRMDPSDTDLLATATRETLEEIGLDLRAHATVVGALPIVDTRRQGLEQALSIAPFVFGVSGEPPIQAGPEVADVFWTPVEPLVSGALDTRVRFQHGGVELSLPGWNVEGRVVWGLTYRMLHALFRAAGWLER